ncbi:FAD-dependent oxidoreductase [Falsirhodobacter halotolerans]|uniref:FAD-dependent oxidoreductase n=1 Tax=Falsirhodobacter halotolerans TaxID=1146892 RepID=UPI001FD5FDC8|nr:FAD-dependent oxidoreductase [Falsirhodobacter halotolerans]MCJ8138342.1 FAD-dependent oxidoreductase [Falsirhodobacter halotolerans]
MPDDTPDLTKGIDAKLLEDGAIVSGTVEGKAVIVLRQGGTLRALSGQCTHLKAPLEKGAVIDGEIRCPWHHARFDLETGEAVGAPAYAPLSCYRVVEVDGRVVVHPRTTRPEPAQAPAAPRVVVIGGGAAGHALAEMMARHGQGKRVTVIMADPDRPYDRTFCSKQYLAGKKDMEDTFLPDLPGVDLRTGAEVERIDPAAKSVTLTDGTVVDYDDLVLATGAEPKRPEFDGMDRTNVHTLRTLDDATRLIDAAKGAERAVILGAGFIGLEVAAALIGRDLSVEVVDRGDLPMAKVLGPEAGAFLRDLHEKKGVVFHAGRQIDGFDGTVVHLDDGTTIEADLLVIGGGVAPRVALAEAAGLDLADHGIAVDATLATSVPHIFAAGDVAATPDPHGVGRVRVEHWVHAQRQGQYLARRFLGMEDGPWSDTPFFWSGHYGTQLRYVGHAKAEDRTIDGDVASGDFAVHYLQDGEERALLTCKRDVLSLETEAAWDADQRRRLAVT